MQLQYAGANNPLWIVRNGGLLEYKADKQPIGRYENRKPFTNHEIELQKGDAIYLFSDGYHDQFGGEKGKKLSKNK
jgi:serine phosphatase RsbU (regulator of sigma subunit)